MIHQKARVKTFKIDGKDVTGKSNQTILEVANENGIDIPSKWVPGFAASFRGTTTTTGYRATTKR